MRLSQDLLRLVTAELKLMVLALVTTMCAAVLFQPVLMGPPRQIQNPSLRRSVAPSPAE